MYVYVLTKDEEILGVFSSWELAWKTMQKDINPAKVDNVKIITLNGTVYRVRCEEVSDEVTIIEE